MVTKPGLGTMVVQEIAQAKVNLCLHVTGQRDDGYHLLDSIVSFAEFGDVLTFAPADTVTLSIGGPFADGLDSDQNNLILDAARCFCSNQGAVIHLEKNLPVASGIGGGSADAAATLRGLAQLWGLAVPDLATQVSLGADVPVCMVPQTVRMRGIGEIVEPLTGWPVLPVVLVNPGVSVSTPVVFKALTEKSNPEISSIEPKDVLFWLGQQRNDLQGPAITAIPVIEDVIQALQEQNANLARMSGSGATCFGVFDTDAQAAAAGKAIAATFPDWWVQTTRLTT